MVEVCGAIQEFILIRNERVHASLWKVIDEPMSAGQPFTTALGGFQTFIYPMDARTI
jgi:hypothetical protein